MRNLDCRLEWCEVFPAKDSLPDVVDRLLALPANRKRILKARQQWGDQGGFDSSLREASAVAVVVVGSYGQRNRTHSFMMSFNSLEMVAG